MLNITLKGDNLMAFQNDWEMGLSGLDVTPPEYILESLYKKQLDLRWTPLHETKLLAAASSQPRDPLTTHQLCVI